MFAERVQKLDPFPDTQPQINVCAALNESVMHEKQRLGQWREANCPVNHEPPHVQVSGDCEPRSPARWKTYSTRYREPGKIRKLQGWVHWSPFYWVTTFTAQSDDRKTENGGGAFGEARVARVSAHVGVDVDSDVRYAYTAWVDEALLASRAVEQTCRTCTISTVQHSALGPTLPHSYEGAGSLSPPEFVGRGRGTRQRLAYTNLKLQTVARTMPPQKSSDRIEFVSFRSGAIVVGAGAGRHWERSRDGHRVWTPWADEPKVGSDLLNVERIVEPEAGAGVSTAREVRRMP
ncbi:hypothetical protein GGX14DRAFT_390272 [Mycena pura]|uniref:Uncharacterized protein n=1 Tax=Mycena pura TaxID=153505 RepID=A0AAD6VS14_9AGAR|nr:hypothetical protein GGX14DRAFT_390272 [Mycena pura]